MIPIISINISDSSYIGYRYYVHSRGYKFAFKDKQIAFRMWKQEMKIWLLTLKRIFHNE